MFNIAICDDDKYICEMIEKILSKYTVVKDLHTSIFYSADAFYNEIANGKYFDLVFLDIMFDSMDGVSAGKKIRDTLQNESLHIAYISGREDFAMDLFEIRPINFLVKPFTEKQILEVLEKAIYLSGISNEAFEFHIDKVFYKVPYKEILYFESKARKIILHGKNMNYEFYGKMDELVHSANQSFIRIHQSYLVNTSYISEYRYDQITLEDKSILNISKAYRSIVRKNLLDTWGEI